MMNHSKLLLLIALLGITLFSSCQKSDGAFCETVVNENGPGFLKVTNNFGSEIVVDLTSIIPLGAHTRAGACEIFGLPIGNHTITIENENASMSKDVAINIVKGETFVLNVTENFF